MSAVLLDDGLSMVTGEEFKKRPGSHRKSGEVLSLVLLGEASILSLAAAGLLVSRHVMTLSAKKSRLGFKRNLCCHLSRGAIIAHFDDDDLCAHSASVKGLINFSESEFQTAIE